MFLLRCWFLLSFWSFFFSFSSSVLRVFLVVVAEIMFIINVQRTNEKNNLGLFVGVVHRSFFILFSISTEIRHMHTTSSIQYGFFCCCCCCSRSFFAVLFLSHIVIWTTFYYSFSKQFLLFCTRILLSFQVQSYLSIVYVDEHHQANFKRNYVVYSIWVHFSK